MMKINCWPRPVFVFASAWILAAGCATETDQSFNAHFNQNLPAAPKYAVENVNDHRFKIVMDQGRPMQDDPGRVTYMKQAVSVVAEDEAHRRGWANWDMNYIEQRDQGWMLILVAEVTRKPALNVTPIQPTPPSGP
jgi:hypothetical protein